MNLSWRCDRLFALVVIKYIALKFCYYGVAWHTIALISHVSISTCTHIAILILKQGAFSQGHFSSTSRLMYRT